MSSSKECQRPIIELKKNKLTSFSLDSSPYVYIIGRKITNGSNNTPNITDFKTLAGIFSRMMLYRNAFHSLFIVAFAYMYTYSVGSYILIDCSGYCVESDEVEIPTNFWRFLRAERVSFVH